jgi:hypothetical protein
MKEQFPVQLTEIFKVLTASSRPIKTKETMNAELIADELMLGQ